MGAYEYMARTATGKQITGVMEADNESAVVRTLSERELFPVRVAQQADRRRGIRRRIRPRDVGVLYGQLADLLRSGVPMLRALDVLSRAGLSRALSEVVPRIREDVSAGKTLAEALDAHPRAFTSLHTAMVRAGERAGFLEDVLTHLAEFLDRQDDLRSKVRGAMVYPIVLTTIGLLAMLVILVWFVPKFQPMFASGTVDLPVPTVLLFAASGLLNDHKLLLVGMIVATVIGIRAFLHSEFGHRLWDRWKLKIPLAGKVTRMVSITRFCRILGTMLANGVPILQALAISKDATGNETIAAAIEEAAENVRAGEPLADPLKASGLFPTEVVEMIAVAEESNQLEKVLVQIADAVERRTNRQVDQAVRLVEPLILVLLAVAIGFVAIGLLYPIFTMSETLG